MQKIIALLLAVIICTSALGVELAEPETNYDEFFKDKSTDQLLSLQKAIEIEIRKRLSDDSVDVEEGNIVYVIGNNDISGTYEYYNKNGYNNHNEIYEIQSIDNTSGTYSYVKYNNDEDNNPYREKGTFMISDSSDYEHKSLRFTDEYGNIYDCYLTDENYIIDKHFKYIPYIYSGDEMKYTELSRENRMSQKYISNDSGYTLTLNSDGTVKVLDENGSRREEGIYNKNGNTIKADYDSRGISITDCEYFYADYLDDCLYYKVYRKIQ